MGYPKKQWSSVLITSILLVGPFSYIQTLLFRPKMLTAYMSGSDLLVSIETQTLVSVVFIIASSIFGSYFIRKARTSAKALIIIFCVLLPLLCGGLIFMVQDLLVPLIVSIFLGISCSFQMQFILIKSPLDSGSSLEDYAMSAIVSLCISSMLSHAGYVFSETDAQGTIFLSLIMFASGLAIFMIKDERAKKLDLEEIKAVQPKTDRARTMLFSILPIMPAAIICAFSLGMAWDNDVFESALRAPYLFSSGAALTVFFLFILKKRWQKRAEEKSDEIILFAVVPAAVGILASFIADLIDPSFLFILLVFSNLSFLSLVWIEMLYLYGRKVFSSSILPFLSIVLVVSIFSVGMILSNLIPPEIAQVIVPLVALGYMVYLFFYMQRSKLYRSSKNSLQLSFDDIKKLACDQMEKDFKLSEKEAEVLSLLVTGISAPAIGKKLFVSHETVKTHKYHIYKKMGVHNFEEMIDTFKEYADRAGS